MTDESNHTKHANIFEAVVAAMNEVGYVRKQRTMGLNYSYAGEAALISALRPVMVDHGIFMYVLKLDDIFQSDFETSKGSKMTRTTLKATIRFQHEDGTFIDVQSAGEGMDSGDKSMNKAMTGAYKYALRQTFCIETGDDPDKHPSQQPAPAHVSQTAPRANAPEVVKNTPTPAPNVSQPTNVTVHMTIEDAEDIENSRGVRYGAIDTPTLAHMVNAMVTKGDPANDRKITAARMIMAARGEGRKVQEA